MPIKILTTNEFIERAKNIHGSKYDYSLVNYISCESKIKIICSIHGEFLQMPYKHIAGNGCIKCRNQKTGDIRRKSLSTFINQSIIIHKNKYDYSQSIYLSDKIKLKIICKNHGEFLQTPNTHLSGEGCPKCKYRISKPEMEFLNYLKIPDTIENRQKRINKFQIDGFDDKINTIYEFLGDYYHGNPKRFNKSDINYHCKKTFGELYNDTFKKFEDLKKLGYNVKYIWENDWNDFKNKKTNVLNVIIYY